MTLLMKLILEVLHAYQIRHLYLNYNDFYLIIFPHNR